jgi:hypothetical protein
MRDPRTIPGPGDCYGGRRNPLDHDDDESPDRECACGWKGYAVELVTRETNDEATHRGCCPECGNNDELWDPRVAAIEP